MRSFAQHTGLWTPSLGPSCGRHQCLVPDASRPVTLQDPAHPASLGGQPLTGVDGTKLVTSVWTSFMGRSARTYKLLQQHSSVLALEQYSMNLLLQVEETNNASYRLHL